MQPVRKGRPDSLGCKVPKARPDLRAGPGAWLRAADEAGLDEEAVTALLAVARHDPREERV